jgi:hypothetical protein
VGIAVLAPARASCAVLASPRRTTRITVPAGGQARTAILVLRAAGSGRSDDARAEAVGGHAEAPTDAGSHAEATAAVGSRPEAAADAAARARAAVLARARPLGSPQAASTIGPSGLGQAALR